MSDGVTLEEKIQQIEVEYAAPKEVGDLVEVRRILYRGIQSLLVSNTDLSQEAHDLLAEMLRQESQFGGEKVQLLLSELGRLETPMKWRLLDLVGDWIQASYDLSLLGRVSSSTALGDLLGAYRLAAEYLRRNPFSRDAVQRHADARERLITQLNESASKRLARAKEAISIGEYERALEYLVSIEENVYGPVASEFPDLLEYLDEVDRIRAESADLREEVMDLHRKAETAREMLSQADQALTSQDFDRSFQLAHQAREVVYGIPSLREEAERWLDRIEQQRVAWRVKELMSEAERAVSSEDFYRAFALADEARHIGAPSMQDEPARWMDRIQEQQVQAVRVGLEDANTKIDTAVTSEELVKVEHELRTLERRLGLAGHENAHEFSRTMNRLRETMMLLQEADSLERHAQESIGQGRFREAMYELEKALQFVRQTKKRSDLQRQLEEVQFQLAREDVIYTGRQALVGRDYKKALESFAEAQRMGAQVRDLLQAARAGELLARAQQAWEIQSLDQAEKHLDHALALLTQNPEAAEIGAEVRHLQQRIERERELGTELRSAHRAKAIGDLDAAGQILETILAEQPKNSEAQELLSHVRLARQIKNLLAKADDYFVRWLFPYAQQALDRTKDLVNALPQEDQVFWDSERQSLQTDLNLSLETWTNYSQACTYWDKAQAEAGQTTDYVQQSLDLLLTVDYEQVRDRKGVVLAVQKAARDLKAEIIEYGPKLGWSLDKLRKLSLGMIAKNQNVSSARNTVAWVAKMENLEGLSRHLGSLRDQTAEEQRLQNEALDEYRERLRDEARAWNLAGWVSAVIFFMAIIYVFLYTALLMRGDLHSMEVAASVIPGVLAAVFFARKDYLDKRMDAEQSRVWTSHQEFISKQRTEIEAVYEQVQKEIRNLEPTVDVELPRQITDSVSEPSL